MTRHAELVLYCSLGRSGSLHLWCRLALLLVIVMLLLLLLQSAGHHHSRMPLYYSAHNPAKDAPCCADGRGGLGAS